MRIKYTINMKQYAYFQLIYSTESKINSTKYLSRLNATGQTRRQFTLAFTLPIKRWVIELDPSLRTSRVQKSSRCTKGSTIFWSIQSFPRKYLLLFLSFSPSFSLNPSPSLPLCLYLSLSPSVWAIPSILYMSNDLIWFFHRDKLRKYQFRESKGKRRGTKKRIQWR